MIDITSNQEREIQGVLEILSGHELEVVCSSSGQFPGRVMWRIFNRTTKSKEVAIIIIASYQRVR